MVKTLITGMKALKHRNTNNGATEQGIISDFADLRDLRHHICEICGKHFGSCTSS
ncbi:MAG TPA: hypothetical protein VG737_18895 [Cyclobacteriaceae bacterium]|nr:hypothetical protein [Cyclobacteriaceae bacterium]